MICYDDFLADEATVTDINGIGDVLFSVKLSNPKFKIGDAFGYRPRTLQ